MSPSSRRIFWHYNRLDDRIQHTAPGMVMPIHRHKSSSETCVCIRDHFEGLFYDDYCILTDTIDMVPGGIALY